MQQKEIYSKLCVYDSRHPEFSRFEESERVSPRLDCHCDNCHYGRDRLAVEILRLQEVIQNYRQRP